MERTGVGYEPFTPEQQQGVFNMLDRYVAADEAAEEEVLSINSFRDILEVCKQFKKMVIKGRQDVDEARLEAQQAVMEQVRAHYTDYIQIVECRQPPRGPPVLTLTLTVPPNRPCPIPGPVPDPDSNGADDSAAVQR